MFVNPPNKDWFGTFHNFMQHNFINSSSDTINLGYQVITGEEKRIQFIFKELHECFEKKDNPFLLFNNTIFLHHEGKTSLGDYFNIYYVIKDYITDRYKDTDQKASMEEFTAAYVEVIRKKMLLLNYFANERNAGVKGTTGPDDIAQHNRASFHQLTKDYLSLDGVCESVTTIILLLRMSLSLGAYEKINKDCLYDMIDRSINMIDSIVQLQRSYRNYVSSCSEVEKELSV